MKLRHLAPFAMLLAASTAACSASTDSNDDTSEDALTSLTALARNLKFKAIVYVDSGASDSEILRAVRAQNQSAFGALRTAKIGVNSRELKDVDTSTFVKTNVKVYDVKANDTTGRDMVKVSYTYTDHAVVPSNMSRRSALPIGLLSGDYGSQTSHILPECTDNDKEAKEFVGSIWYVFNPSLSSCKTAMTAEQKNIDADHAKLLDKKGVPLSEVNRLYAPLTVSLTRALLNGKASYPEYDKLYAGGVVPGKLVVGMVSGLMADWAAGEHHDTIDDEGYAMWFGGLRNVFTARPGMKLVKTVPSVDFTSIKVGTKTYAIPGGFDDVMKWELDSTGFPAGTTSAQQHALRVAAGDMIVKHWLTFEAPVKVSIGSGAQKDVTIQLNSYFGAETDSTPHKQAIKNSDVFIYNGHSYIGYGPLDPSHFSASDFPASYQIMVVNGCVSYNYYEKDYFPLKPGGTKNLELITNGLESWVNESGPAMGRLVGAIINGKQSSYTDILKAAQFTEFGYDWGMDALRVVDGELDNKYSPTTTPITFH
ncbi:MAG: hypothetical protein ABIP39_16275 [Polyangiaceae bacterium]